LPLEDLDDVVGKLGAAAATITAALGGPSPSTPRPRALVGR
jgi:hypothetical protein